MILYKVVITEDLNISASVLLALMWYKQDKVLNQKILAKSLKCSDRTIRNYLKELQEKQYIASACVGKNGDFLVYKKWFLKKTFALYDTEKERRKREQRASEKAEGLTALFNSVIYGKKR